MCPVLAVLALSACGTPNPRSASAGAPELVVPSSDVTPDPSAAAQSPAGDLGTVAWWATETLAFGVIPEAPPDPDPPVNPGAFRQLSIGTLDGRVTAVLALHDAWGHSYVAGPYGTDVLVANDVGTRSEVFLVSTLDGARTDLFASPEIVAAVALGDDGESIYYVELSRDGEDDLGLWRRAIDGGEATQVLPGPIGDEAGDPRIWWVTADPLDGRVVVQSCFGEVRCTTVVVDSATGETDERTDLGWPLGADGATFVANGLGPTGGAYIWDLATDEPEFVAGAADSVPVRVDGEWRLVRGEAGVPEGATLVIDSSGEVRRLAGDDRPGSVLDPLGERRGVSLPNPWVMRWPPISIHQLGGPMGPPGQGQLIDIATATRVDLPMQEHATPLGSPCEIPVPAEMPTGQRPGFGVPELLDGRWTVRWGPMGASVVVAAAPDTPDQRDALEGAGTPVRVRGTDGEAVLIGDEGVGETAFTWSDAECRHTVWLPAGTTLDATIDYAERY